MTPEARGLIRKHFQAIDFFVKASHDPTGKGEMRFVVTKEITLNREKLVQSKRCAACAQFFPFIAFIKGQTLLPSGHLLITDAPQCHVCVPPPVFAFHFVDGHLAMRLELHTENGQLIDVWDPSTLRWQPMRERGLRLMTDSNVIRFQPRTERSRSATTGFDYGKGPLLPLDD